MSFGRRTKRTEGQGACSRLAGSGKRQYFIAFTLVYCVVFFLVFSWYILTGKTFIWHSDGWNQHYRALVQYGKYLRSSIRSFLGSGKIVIPNWDFNIGEGDDILRAFHYYAIGDPLNLLSVFVPSRYMYYLYDFLVFLRMYLAGVVFSLLCYQTGIKNRHGILAGALSYVFCYWALFNAARHPFFLNPLIYMPLLILGFEKIIAGERPYVLIAAVCLTACSNFYFFYMMVLLAVAYVLIRLACIYRRKEKDRKAVLAAFGKITAASIMGGLFSSVILFPMLYVFLSNSRLTATEDAGMLLYPITYYFSIPAMLAGARGGGYWLYMGMTSLTTLAILLLFREKGHREVKVCLFVCLCFVLVPFFGKALNGFSYIANRWCWGIALVFAFALAVMWPQLIEIDRHDAKYLTTYVFILFILCLLLENSRKSDAFVSLVIMLVGLLAIVLWRQEGEKAGRKEQLFLLLLVVVSIMMTSFWKNAPAGGGEKYANEAIEAKKAETGLNNNETKAIKKATENEEGFFRYTGSELTSNAALSAELSSTQRSWSLGSSDISSYRMQMRELTVGTYSYKDHDGRAMLDAFSSAKYYVQPHSSDNAVPYGYEKLGDYIRNRFTVYTTQNALPLGYTYENVIGDETWNGLSAVEKQEAMLQAVYLAGGEDTVPADGLTFTGKSIPYTVTCEGEQVTQQVSSFVVTAADAKVTLEFSGLEDCETYLSLDNIRFNGSSDYELYFGGDDVDPQGLYGEEQWNKLSHSAQRNARRSAIFWTEPQEGSLEAVSSSGCSKTVYLYNENYQFYNGRHDFIANFGYTEDAVTSITLTFPAIGIYTFDALEVICQPMATFPAQVDHLREDTLENVEIGTDQVSGTITLDEPKILCFSIPYSIGWTAYVDGEETPVEKANVMYMALPLEAGEHEIELRYATPYLKLGEITSAVSFVLLAVYVVHTERKRRAVVPTSPVG